MNSFLLWRSSKNLHVLTGRPVNVCGEVSGWVYLWISFTRCIGASVKFPSGEAAADS